MSRSIGDIKSHIEFLVERLNDSQEHAEIIYLEKRLEDLQRDLVKAKKK